MRALAEPRRQAILQLVWDRALPAGEIAAHFDITRPAISQHLRVLKDADLISEHRRGTQRLYRARPETVAELRTFLDHFWAGRLNLLKAAVENEQTERSQHDNAPKHSD